MSKIRLTGSNSGYVEIASAADAGNLTFLLPTSGTGLLGNGNNVYTGITTFTNDLKLEGGSYDVLWDASDNQLEFDDNAKLSFGASSDLSIYHDGSQSIIADTGTGQLALRGGTTVSISNAAGTEVMANFINGGACNLFHNGVNRIATTATGTVVTGIMTATEINYTGSQNLSNRNIIINGAMRIAQRGTAAVTVTGTASYRCVDRWKTDIDGSGGGDFSHAQSTDVPTGQGFRHSSKITTVTQASQPTSVDNHHQIYQLVEKNNVYHLDWGTSAAKTCTLSFWVKGSITGTYGLWFSIYTSIATKYYWTNYTINSANTWEKKVITITGPTSGGAIDVSTGTGLRVEWLLGSGSDTETGTLNEWTTSNTIRSASGTVYLPENAGATWYITGVQFEVGSVATPFEHRSFNDDYLRCCRYYFGGANTYVSGSNYYGSVYSSGNSMVSVPHPVPMRATPTASQPSQSGGGTFTQVYENSCITQYYFSGDTTVSVPAAEVDISAEL